MTDKPFPEALDELLRERDWSQRMLSRKLREEFGPDGTSHSSIRLWLNNDLAPTLEAMERVAKVLRIDADYFAEVRLERVRDALNWRRVGVAPALRSLDALRDRSTATSRA